MASNDLLSLPTCLRDHHYNSPLRTAEMDLSRKTRNFQTEERCLLLQKNRKPNKQKNVDDDPGDGMRTIPSGRPQGPLSI